MRFGFYTHRGAVTLHGVHQSGQTQSGAKQKHVVHWKKKKVFNSILSSSFNEIIIPSYSHKAAATAASTNRVYVQ